MILLFTIYIILLFEFVKFFFSLTLCKEFIKLLYFIYMKINTVNM